MGLLYGVGADGAFDEGLYRIELNTGDLLLLETFTPGDQSFGNGLDPHIELIDPSGRVVASDDNSAADGRNASLTFPVTQGGTYGVRVAAAEGTESPPLVR